MIRFEVSIPISSTYANAIQKAISILGQRGVNNIWDHRTLNTHLSSRDASELIQLQRYLKTQLIQQVGPYCSYCHVYHKNPNRFQLDHFVIKSIKYGTAKYAYEIENILLSCKYCNDEKHTEITFDKLSVSVAPNYQSLIFTCYHPNIHILDDNFEILSKSVVAKTPEAKDFLRLIEYSDPRTNEKIMGNFEIRKKNNYTLEDRVRLISSSFRERSSAV